MCRCEKSGAERVSEAVALVDCGSSEDVPTAVALPGGYVMRRRGGAFVIAELRIADCGLRIERQGPVLLAFTGRTEVQPGLAINCAIEAFDPKLLEAYRRSHAAGEEIMDADQIRGPLVCRPRRAGDSFWPLGARCPRRVTAFLKNQKFPHARRDEALCICDELGLIYLHPLRIDERVKVIPATKRVLRIKAEYNS